MDVYSATLNFVFNHLERSASSSAHLSHIMMFIGSRIFQLSFTHRCPLQSEKCRWPLWSTNVRRNKARILAKRR